MYCETPLYFYSLIFYFRTGFLSSSLKQDFFSYVRCNWKLEFVGIYSVF